MTTRSVVASIGVALAVVLAGCTGESGKPKPEPTATGDATQTDSASSTPTSGSNSGGLASVDPCKLLVDAETAEMGLPSAGKPTDTAGDPTCVWQATGKFGLRLGLKPTLGVKDLNYNGKTPTPITIGKHPATKVPGGVGGSVEDNGSCQVFIEVTESSSVGLVVTNTGSRGTDLACQRAEQAAKFIDSRLP